MYFPSGISNCNPQFSHHKRCQVPLPSVPCMNYKKALAAEEQAKEEARERQAKGEVLPKAQVESAEDAMSRYYR